MSEKNSNLLKGLFIGGLIGMALGILFAPKSGKETREDIAGKADELLSKAKEEYEKVVEKNKTACQESINDFKEKATDAENKVSEFVHQGSEVIQNNKNRFKKAIDAGLEAYREENSKNPV